MDFELPAEHPARTTVREWLAEHPEPSPRELADAGYVVPHWPKPWGLDADPIEQLLISDELKRANISRPINPIGIGHCGPILVIHGSDAQKQRYIPPMLSADEIWCQLFSEPGAGSDLAGLSTKAVEEHGEYIINGQKVWTSGGQNADMGMLLARTDPSVPKHQGITWFAFDMLQPGVDVRPLREMSGHALFSEVFLSDARVSADAVINGVNNGWAAANTTLMYERAGLGAGGSGGGFGFALPGIKAGHLDRRVGDFVPKQDGQPARRGRPAQMRGGAASLYVGLAKGNGKFDDPNLRQQLAHLHIISEIGRLNGERLKATRAAGSDIPGMANIAKLLMSDIVRLSRDVGMQIVGAQGMLQTIDPEKQKVLDEATGNPFLAGITASALMSPAPSIYGGTDQVQRNIIGERALGLPKEPRDDHIKPFNEVARNK
jgi:alkylation response protein AidB-like acyl-CoA dehydrogenase